jgi:EAL domain-containing protein (putative c-di-GMP-specific phosphodiesterase class I)
VRWRHPERGLISPADFIPVAEDSSLIVLLDLHVLRSAAAQVAVWRQKFKTDLSVSVNASRKHFARAAYATDVQQALDVAGLPPTALRLEVTESLTMDLPAEALAHLKALHGLGVQLYVDDFGMGYSSLSMLHTYPFAGIKLDRSFVAGMEDASSSTEVVKAILAIAQALRLDVVAEGVETEVQANKLISLGCGRAQGFLYGRPMRADAAQKWLSERL